MFKGCEWEEALYITQIGDTKCGQIKEGVRGFVGRFRLQLKRKNGKSLKDFSLQS